MSGSRVKMPFAKRSFAADGPSKEDTSTQPRVVYPDSAEGRAFFRKRTIFIAVLAAGFVVINAISASFVEFDPVAALVDFPSALVWMATNFVPSSESLAKMPQILNALASTVLAAIASSMVAAVLAYILAVLGSRSVGLGGPFPLVVRGIASLFRNIPVVAWAFILLFSFNQSEFTGFLALFLGSFGYLTRCFLESVDEISGGVVEALRATGQATRRSSCRRSFRYPSLRL